MRFLADMGISPRVVEELRLKGHDATHLLDEGLYRMSDGEILEKARLEKYILLTHMILILANYLPPVVGIYQVLSSFALMTCAHQTSTVIFSALSTSSPKL
jgi:hypothetical protein